MSDGLILEIDPDPDPDLGIGIGLIVWIDSGKIVDIDKIEMRIPIARRINPNGREVKVEVAVAVGIEMARVKMNHRGGKREDARVVIDTMETVIVIVVIEGKDILDPGPIGTGVALAAAQVGNEIGIRIDIDKRIDKGILNVVIGTNLGNEDAWKKVEVGAIETAGGTTIEIEKHDSITNPNPNPNHSMMTEERTGSPQTFA